MKNDCENKTLSVLLVGVGGQGTILAGKIMSAGLEQSGYDVKMSEIHGMSQRGGSVTTHIRFSKDKVYSPVIEKGKADLIVAFEKMEAMRYIDYLAKDGKIIVNDFEIPGIPITMGDREYPKGVLEALKAQAEVTVINANNIAEELGNPKVMNVVILGAAVKKTGLEGIDWQSIIAENVKPRFIDVNIAAFKAGYDCE
ncbi:MAG: indolepyruvate oxidoreductase subunit beta [Clostridia bacterium]|nr:indolepyruvate oxidoreductase subunit beta [Clostridia bacterium]